MRSHCHVVTRRRFLATSAAVATGLAGRDALGRVALAVEKDASQNGAPLIDCDFPGGNIVVERIEGDRVDVHQDLRDTPGWWFYWCFRVRNAAGRTLAFHFTNKDVFAARGPAVSTDGGKTWAWLGTENVEGTSFTYTFPTTAEEVRFCLAMPYLEANLRAFLDRHRGNPHLRVEHHATTKKGRKAERLRLGRLDGEPDHRVLITCRHHACEMIAGWALEGLLEAVLADTDDGRWLRRHVEFLVVPFVDKDGVEDGDQGKNRKPHDHNRDYVGESIYPSVAALKELVPKWSQGKLCLTIDMHCPWIRGGGDNPSSNERIFLVGNPDQGMWDRQQEFSKILQEVQRGPLVYNPKNNLPFGQAWNTLKEPRSSSRWMALQPGVLLATTLEIPYADVAGQAVTVETARAFGQDLARAMRAYLQANK